MSQNEVIKILLEMGGEATSTEINEEAKRRFPDRSIDTYTHKRLASLDKKGLVESKISNGNKVWEVTQKGREYSTEEIFLSNVDENCTQADLNKAGIEISNIVATIDLADEFDLHTLDEHLSGASYYPETDSHLTYSISEGESPALRVPSTGRVTITGAQNKNDVVNILSQFCSDVENLGIDVCYGIEDIVVQNIVATIDLERELDLSSLAKDIDENNFEYNPDAHSALVYRLNIPGTLLIYRTGKVIINGIKSYSQIMSAFQRLDTELQIST